jgi:succinylarginine dihydrolase
MLNAVFTDRERFEIHHALAANADMGDEGAANHTRLFDVASANQPATHFFVYGIDSANPQLQPKIHPARQRLQASRRVAEVLQLDPARCVFAQQNPEAIDQGVFHNDVVAVGNASTLLYHQDAWLDHDRVIDSLAQRVGDSFCPITVNRDELTIAEAVTTYLFNSQLVTTQDGFMTLVCPSEVQYHARANAVALRIQQDSRNSISRILYMDVRESMRNGGGPACLRLRVPLAPTTSHATNQTSGANLLAGSHKGCIFNTERAAQLRAWIERWYPEQLTPEDLADPQLLIRNRDALDALTQQLGLASIYPFQGVSPLKS